MPVSEDEEDTEPVVTEVSGLVSDQTTSLVESDAENVEDATTSPGNKMPTEASVSDKKITENIQVDVTAANLELVNHAAERTSEDEPLVQQEVDRLIELEQNSPSEIDIVKGLHGTGHMQQNLYESSGAVSCCCLFGILRLK